MPLIPRIISLCILIQLAITWKLWIPVGRNFPMISAFEFLPVGFGLVGDALLTAVLVASLLLFLLRPFSRIALALFASSSLLLVLEDVTRLQPWLYTFGLILLMVVGTRSRSDVPLPPKKGKKHVSSSNEEKLWGGILLVLAAIYFWSGFHKLNVDFTTEIFPWMLDPLGLAEWGMANPWSAWCAAIFELMTGVGLLFLRTRRIAAVAATLTHLFVIVVLTIQGWNMTVLPWNMAMIALVWIATAKKARLSLPWKKEWREGSPRTTAVRLIVLLLAGIAPAFFLVGLWDSYLSHSLYSGNGPEAIFYYHTDDRKGFSQVPNDFLLYREGKKEEFLLIPDWCVYDVQVPSYPAERYFRRIGKYLCDCVERKDSAGVRVSLKQPFTSKGRLKEFSCAELLRE